MAEEAFLAFCPSASRRPPMIEIRQDPKMFRQFDIEGIVVYKIFVDYSANALETKNRNYHFKSYLLLRYFVSVCIISECIFF